MADLGQNEKDFCFEPDRDSRATAISRSDMDAVPDVVEQRAFGARSL